MRAAVPLLLLGALLPSGAAAEDDQGNCLALGWTHPSGSRSTTIEPSVDRYEGRITATANPCTLPPSDPCPRSPGVTFRVKAAPPWANVTFSPPTAPLTGPPFPAQGTASTTVAITFNITAPAAERPTIEVEAQCGSHKASISRPFEVGIHFEITASLARAFREEASFAWAVLLENHGNYRATVNVRPQVSQEDASQADWDYEPQVDLGSPLVGGDNDDARELVIRIARPVIGENYTVLFYPGLDANEDTWGRPASLRLDFATFEGRSTSSVPLLMVAAALLGTASIRRQRPA